MSQDTVSASATGLPADREILEAYREWLHYEGRLLGMELYPDDKDGDAWIPGNTLATRFHFPHDKPWNEAPQPSTRAKLVLQAVGVLPEKEAPADLASLEFEPWKHVEGEWKAPTDEEWGEMRATHLVTIRLALATMYQTKEHLVEGIPALGDSAGRALMEAFTSARTFFKGMEELIESAEARILCAGSTYLQSTEQDDVDNEEEVTALLQSFITAGVEGE